MRAVEMVIPALLFTGAVGAMLGYWAGWTDATADFVKTPPTASWLRAVIQARADAEERETMKVHYYDISTGYPLCGRAPGYAESTLAQKCITCKWCLQKLEERA